MRPALVIGGSARRGGDTDVIVAALRGRMQASVAVALIDLSIDPFAYGMDDAGDDFLPLVDAMLATDDIIFASPVYWYAMSARMKALFDRFTQLLHDDGLRDRARGLAGRRGWLVTTGTDPELPPGFDKPFARTCRYMGMHWCGHVYARARGGEWVERSAPALDAMVERMRVMRGGRV